VSGTGTAGNPYTWGNLLDMTTAMTNIGANLSLKPVGYSTKTEGSETKVVMKTPQYGLDGRVAKLVDMAQEYISAYDGVTTPSGGISIFKQTEDTDEADALALSFWLRANEDVKLQLSQGTFRADDGEITPGTVNAEFGSGSRLVLTVPTEAAEKVLSIQTQVSSILTDMTADVYDLLLAVYNYDSDMAEYFQTLWNTHYEQLENLFSENIVNLPLCYSIRGVFSSQPDHPEYSLEEMDELMNMSVSDLFSANYDGYFHYDGNIFLIDPAFMGEGGWGMLEAAVSPSPQMLRLLNKLKIRFVVSSDEGTQELYAKIAPNYYTDVSYSMGYTFSSAYGYQFEKDGVKYGDVLMPEPDVFAYFFKERPTELSNGNQFQFELNFFDKNDAGYSDYLDALIAKLTVVYHIYGNPPGLENAIYSAILAGAIDDPYEVYTDYDDFMYEVSDRRIQACLEQFPHIELSANEAKKVDVYMYLDGELITNADAATIDGLDLSLNLQFEKIGGAKNAMTGRVYEEESESESE